MNTAGDGINELIIAPSQALRPAPLFAPTRKAARRFLEFFTAQINIETRIGNHTFRATGITAYLKNSGRLEVAQQIANHESPRTTKLYDRRQDEISLDEIERITI
jgi:integrase